MPLERKSKDDFEFGDLIGEGSFGQVFKAVDKTTQTQYAIKVLDKKQIVRFKKVKYVSTEKEILGNLRHPNIVKLFFTFQDQEHLYFVLEYCEHGELLDVLHTIGKLPAEIAKNVIAEVVLGLEHLRENDIIHRDLKPENILVDENWHTKISDFGTAKIISDERDRTGSFCGTAEYIAPELLEERTAGKGSDLWALGCIVFQLISGILPFKHHVEYQLFQQILNGQYEYPDDFPEEARDLCDRLLTRQPTERIGHNNFDELKKHDFFAGVDWDNVPPSDLSKLEPKPREPKPSPVRRGASLATIDADEAKKWSQFLLDGEEVLFMGLVFKRKGLFGKRRQLILTSKPRLLYVDPEKMVQKGEIEWSGNIKPIMKKKRVFFVQTPDRTYNLEDLERESGMEWVGAIERELERFMAAI
eukprot:TRINITY_DN41374_c0_g1_i1.p1 TRINITY_DN41374_c0_g1~~TRINITY_DN41374_c0_g1_i1.p1  ORF type:complete len:416 (+),score=59.56 TRINITY_DN41374_c0_g1_i1:131-1378(+)